MDRNGEGKVSVSELVQFVGKKARLEIDGFEVEVVVRDVKFEYGNVRSFVEVLSAKQGKWVNFSRLEFKEAKSGTNKTGSKRTRTSND